MQAVMHNPHAAMAANPSAAASLTAQGHPGQIMQPAMQRPAGYTRSKSVAEGDPQLMDGGIQQGGKGLSESKVCYPRHPLSFFMLILRHFL